MAGATDALTERIIGAAIEVHRILGPGLLEGIYEDALCVEMTLREIVHQRQVDQPMVYKGHSIRGQRIDLLVAAEVVVEIKSVRDLPVIAMAQVLSYLKATGLKRGLLINFGASRLVDGIKRISLRSELINVCTYLVSIWLSN
jgi:GxxExxY protein